MLTQKEYIDIDNEYGTHNYKPLPVVIEKGSGVFLWDIEGKKYFDFLAGYSAVNQGHCHPKIVNTLCEQAKVLTLTSRAYHTRKLSEYQKYITNYFGFDKMLPMNSGAEAVETAVKLIRKWSYVVKGIENDKAIIIFASNNFHGRTLMATSASTDEVSRGRFGPMLPGIKKIIYNDINSAEEAFRDPNVGGIIIEPLQGEAGVIVPNDGYLKKIEKLCKKNNVLLACDEIQTGIGRAGKLLASEYDGVTPNLVTLGKSLSGGMMPSSAVLGNNEVMNLLKLGEHGSTFGGNPLASAVAVTALEVVKEENLVERSYKLGFIFREKLREIKSPFVKEVRGKGLMNAVEILPNKKFEAADICLTLIKHGILARTTKSKSIRLTPPLVITEEQLLECAEKIKIVIEGYN